MIVQVLFSFVFVKIVLGDADPTLLIRKCCGERQKLDTFSTKCVDLEANSHGSDVNKNISVTELRRETTAGFPWWMDSEVKPLSTDTFNALPSFLEGQDEEKYVEIGVQPSCDPHMMTFVNPASTKVKLLHNGSLIHDAANGSSITFSPQSYCADTWQSGNRTAYVYLLCPCLESTCIKKCCPSRKILSFEENKYSLSKYCVHDNGSSWQPQFFDRDEFGNFTELDRVNSHFLFYSRLECPNDRVAIVTDSSWWMYPNGSVLVEDFGGGVPFGPEHYCGDLVIEADRTEHIVVCVEKGKPRELETGSVAYGVILLIGAFFLAVTLIVFALLPRRLRDVLAKCVMCHCASLLAGHIFLCANWLRSTLPHDFCISLPFIIQFSFLAAFFWLNVMCIDISWAFSGFRSPQGSVIERDRKKFLYYSLYAWGCPSLISIVTAIMEFVEAIPDSYIKPDFGIRACWFKEKNAAFAYFYGPMAVLLLANFALFIYTTVKIILVQRETRILQQADSSCHGGSSNNFKKDKKRLILYAKLFCLMGLTWITEIISWLHGSPQYYWYITDAINLLRAVFIFIIFCCKRKVFRLLKQRLFPTLASQSANSQSNSTRKISNSSTQHSSLQSVQMTQMNGNANVDPKPAEHP